MKHPVLRVKKGAEHYDDSPAEGASDVMRRALAPGSRGSAGSRRSAARRRRFPFLPLLALGLGLLVVFRFLPRSPADRAAVGGWEVVLRATPEGNRLIITVAFVQAARSVQGAPSGDAPQASARVLLPDTGDRISLSGTLAKSPMTLRGEMPYTTRVRSVKAEVTVGSDSKTLSLTARSSR